MILIESQATLDKNINQIKSAKILAVDTEFLRTKTYFAKLCLIQIATNNQQYLIDVLADLDLSEMKKIFESKKILKIFHSSRQDLEILHQFFDIEINNIFDTQLAEMLISKESSLGYANIVAKYKNVYIDKKLQFTDWYKRPLSAEHIEYAAKDVEYLIDIYQVQKRQLEKVGRLEWAYEEFKVISDISNYKLDVSNSWLKLNSKPLCDDHQKILEVLALWREDKAISLDVPKNRIIDDKSLIWVSKNIPRVIRDFYKMPSNYRVKKIYKDEIIDLLKGYEQFDHESYTDFQEINQQKQSYKTLRNMLNQISDQHNISEQIIATKSDLNEISNQNSDIKDLPIMKGWRFELFGKKAKNITRK